MIKINNYILIRIAGINAKKVLELSNTPLKKRIIKLERLKKDGEILKNVISKKLYILIANAKDKKNQNKILNFRRDFYNGRNLNNEKYSDVFLQFDYQLKNDFIKYKKCLAFINKEEVFFSKLYVKYENKQRMYIKKMSRNSVLRNGLVLSSSDLLDNLDKYIECNLNEFTKSEYTTEYSILKYITRITTKTSPFSTFTQLSCLNKDLKYKNIYSNKYRSKIIINNYIYQFLQDALFNNKDFYSGINIRLNPSIRIFAFEYQYLQNSKNREAFQKIKKNLFLDLIYKILNSKKIYTFSSLIEETKQFVDATNEDIETYVFNLIKVGFLEFDYKISGLDSDWDSKFISLLKNLSWKGELKTLIIDTLKSIRVQARIFANSSYQKRKKILSNEYDKIMTLAHSLEEASNSDDTINNLAEEGIKNKFTHFVHKNLLIKPKNLFYEDTTVECNIDLNISKVKKLTNILAEFMENVNKVPSITIEKSRMLEYFKDKYLNQEVNILDFYEGYYRDVELAIEKYIATINENHNNTSLEPKYIKSYIFINNNKKAEAWFNEIEKKINYDKENDTIKISSENLKLMSEIEPKISKQPVSYGAFVQFAKYNNQIVGYVNSITNGYGKYLSRFLHNFPNDITKRQIQLNKKYLSNKHTLVENCDASFFNANIHPALFEHQISMPSSSNSLPNKNLINISKVYISLENDDFILKYNEKIIKVYDVDFQSIDTRSKLFKMLVHLSHDDYFSQYYFLINSINKSYKFQKKGGSIFPRIVYENTFILQRKVWLFEIENIPFNKTWSNEEFYKNIVEWANENEMPDEVFVYISKNNRETIEINDDYKPQYISFSSPLLIQLLRKLLRKASNEVRFVEMTPKTSETLKVNGNQKVTECLIQWYER
ncbi:lantibiotic dehydratase [Runella limosa]|uniref:lantibiotic dehydratase n=1 Tax=Runella limosa TaxID=370978 RepID=UPI000415E265|nr:lantibiotic dehydratase [Runella limosa]